MSTNVLTANTNAVAQTSNANTPAQTPISTNNPTNGTPNAYNHNRKAYGYQC